MKVAISPIREFKIVSKDNPDLWVKFKFKGEEEAYRLQGETGSNSLYRLLRSSITEVHNFVDLEGKDIEEVTEAVQLTVWSYILTQDAEMLSDVLIAYQGITPKKLKSGVLPQGSGTGDQQTATPAS